MTLAEIFTWLIEKRADLAAIAFIILVAGAKKKWVWGYQLVDMTNDRDFWRNVAISGTSLAKDVVSLTTKK